MRGRDIPRSLVQEDGESGMIFAIKAERRDSCGPQGQKELWQKQEKQMLEGLELSGH